MSERASKTSSMFYCRVRIELCSVKSGDGSGTHTHTHIIVESVCKVESYAQICAKVECTCLAKLNQHLLAALSYIRCMRRR